MRQLTTRSNPSPGAIPPPVRPFVFGGLLLGVVLVDCSLTPRPAAAQPTSAAPQNPAPAAATPQNPGPQSPPAANAGPQNAGPQNAGPANAPPENPAPPQAVPEEEDDATENIPLPPGYVPPQEPPELMREDMPLLEEGAEEKFKQIRTEFKRALTQGDMSPSARQVLSDALRYRVLVLANPSERRYLARRVNDVLNDLKQAGRGLRDDNELLKFREFVLNEVLNNAVKLLDNNYFVRLNAAVLLSKLNLREGIGRDPAVPYAAALEPLLQIVTDRNQPVAVKIAATRGLQRISEATDLSVEVKSRLTRALVDEFEDVSTHWWYQATLAEAMAAVDMPRVTVDGVRVPLAVHTLTAATADRRRHWLVRSEAAMALGRAPLDAQMRVGFIANRIAELAREMAMAFSKDRRAYFWPDCFLKVYLAFQPIDEAERTEGAGLLTKVSRGALQAQQAEVQAAYDSIKPLAAHMANAIGGQVKPFDPAAIKQLNDYLQQNQPRDFRVDPTLPAIGPPTATAAERGQPAGE